MNTIAFSKPPPAEPLPLHQWMDRVDRSEVGREAFFRGRDKEFEVFRRAVNSLKLGEIGGGTMVFQGAPGAGKTALMQECMEAVRLHSTLDDLWVAVSIRPGTLNSPTNVVKTIVQRANQERERLEERYPDQVPENFQRLKVLGRSLLSELSKRAYTISTGEMDVTMHGKSEDASNLEIISAEIIFQDAVPLLQDMHTVVFIDEAQNTPVQDAAQEMLDCLHNPPEDISLIAAFFGLGDTEDVLRKCGLSRFADERLVTLEPLPYPCARDVMQSIFDAYQFAGSSRRKWIDALAELSQGWPQHINRVSIAAGRTILDHGGRVDDELLNPAVKRGIEAKQRYYVQRLKACSAFPPVLFKRVAMALQDKSSGISRDELFDLATPALDKRNLIFDDFLNTALHAGVLMQSVELPGHYQIPIPSFGDYLRGLPVDPPP